MSRPDPYRQSKNQAPEADGASERKGVAMGTTDDGPGRTQAATSGTTQSAAAANGTATAGATVKGTAAEDAERRRINHMPGAGTPRADAISAGRREMLTDSHRLQIKTLAERGAKRPRIGADAVCEALVRQGVELFFGYPGGVVLPL